MPSQPKETQKKHLTLKVLRTYAEKFVLRLRESAEEDDDGEETQHFGVSIEFNSSDLKKFEIKFDAYVRCESDKIFHVLYVGVFEAGEEIDRVAFAESPFALVNAPAIIYPFLRAFVSTITLNAGYSPVLLPSVNFQALYAKQKEEKAQKELDAQVLDS